MPTTLAAPSAQRDGAGEARAPLSPPAPRRRHTLSPRPRRRRPLGWALALASVTHVACGSVSSDREALERELSKAQAAPVAGTPADPVSSARVTGTQRLETILPPTRLRGAGGLGCHEGRVWVTEPFRDRLSTVRADGTVRRAATPRGLTRPVDLTFDDAGRLWVATSEPGGVWRRDPAAGWDRVGEHLSDLAGLAFAPDGRLLVSECARGGRLVAIDAGDGRLVEEIATGLGCPGRLAVRPDGTILVPRVDHGDVLAIDPATKERRVLARELRAPSAVAVAPDGSPVVLESDTGRVLALAGGASDARAGAVIASLLPGIADLVVCGETVVVSNGATGSLEAFKPWPGGARTLVRGGLVVPSGLVFDGADLIVADRASIKRIRNGQMEVLLVSRVGGLPPPVGLAGGLPGVVWVTAPEEGELLQVELGRRHGTRIAGGFDWPTSVVRTPGGSLVVAETGAGRIVTLGMGFVPYTLASSLISPVGLATRGERVLTAEPDGGRVLSIRTDAAPTVVASGLASPAGLATAPGRPLYIAEEGRGSIVSRSSDGTEHRIAEGLALQTGGADRPLPVPIAIGPNGEVVVASPEDGSLLRIVPN